MNRRSTSRRIALALLALFLTGAVAGTAQPFDRYRNVSRDSLFRIGAHLVPNPVELARDTLKLDFTYHYSAPNAAKIAAPSTWEEALDSVLYMQPGRGDSIQPLQTIFQLPMLEALKHMVLATDSYPFHNPALQMLAFNTPAVSLRSLEFLVVGNDPTMLQTISLPANSAGLLVGAPRAVSTQGWRRSDSARYADPLARPFFDIGNGNSALGRDSSYMVRFSFHIQVEDNESLTSSTDVLRIVLLRRLTIDTCRCAIYEPFFDTLLTKGQYDSSNFLPYPLVQFKDVGFWFDMRDTSGSDLGWYSARDTLYYHAQPGGWYGSPASDATSLARCAAYLDSLQGIDGLINDSTGFQTFVEESDIYYDVHTTGKAKVTFLRGRVAMHEFEALMNHRLGSFIEEDVRQLLDPDTGDSLFAVRDTIRQRIFRLGMQDEPYTPEYEAFAFLADTLQDLISRYAPDSTLGLFQNPTMNYDGFRRLMFDLDTSLRKRAHMMTRQRLPVIATPVPVFYVRPDKMVRPGVDDTLWKRYYPPEGDNRLVAFNTTADYLDYTARLQASLGMFRDYPDVQTYGAIVPTLARMLSVAKFEHADRVADSIPVYNVVTVHGTFNRNTAHDLTPGWFDGIRPKTPEEIAVQAFLTLHGAQGIEFDELSFEGVNLGIADRRYGSGRVNWDSSCSSWASRLEPEWSPCDSGEWDWANPPYFALGDARDTLKGTPQMWLGFRSRFLAVKRIVEEIRLIAPVYQTLNYRMEQMSVHDTRQSFDTMPMVAGLRMQRANTAYRDSIVPLATSDSVDARDSTYAELSHLYPGSRDTSGVASNARYVMICNRRTWPSDNAWYGLDTAKRSQGFGFIDVRRPLITLKNSTPVMADSFLVEKVGHEDSLHWGAKAGVEFALDWLEPGWGGLYRITPIPLRISTQSTAYPNAVRSVDIDGDEPFGPGSLSAPRQVIVYERDSVVYLRARQASGVWTDELMVSDAADLDTLGASVAWNFNPAVGVVVKPNLEEDGFRVHAMVVWERHEYRPDTSSRVVGRIVELTGDDSVLTNSRGVDTLSLEYATAALDSLGIRMTPAITGVSSRVVEPFIENDTAHDGGFAVAWATPSKQIDVRFVNAISGAASDITQPARSATILALTSDTTCSYPTLAYGRTRHFKHTDQSAIHLAFQQGAQGVRNHIVYSQMRLAPLNGSVDSATAPRVFLPSSCEHVSAVTPGCSFMHPSIAADGARVGVAFEAHGAFTSIVLRFRPDDTAASWRSTLYRWGAKDTITSAGFPRFLPVVRAFTWPSLTHFPAVPSAELLGMPLGAIAWQWVSGAPPIRNRQYLYWYGRTSEVEIARGQFAVLTLAPNIDSFAQAPAHTGVFYRGIAADSINGTNIRGIPTTYYPPYLRPIAEQSALQSAYGGRVIETFSLMARTIPEPCEPVMLGGGLIVPTPMLSPRWFLPPGLDTLIPSTLELASAVARTAVFEADTTPVTVTRIVSGSASLASWLETPAFNPPGMPPADVAIVLELVDDSTETVLWRSDTVSARALGDDELFGEVEVPVPQHTDQGDMVYVRMVAIPSDSIEYHVTTEFMIVGELLGGGGGMSSLLSEGDSSETELLKTTLRLKRSDRAVPDGATAITLQVFPNPARDVLQIQISTRVTGSGVLRLIDELGGTVRSEPIELSEPGAYAKSEPLGGLPSGVYSIVVSVDGQIATTRFTVVR